MSDLKRTPLYDVYTNYGGRIVEFAGWEMPVQYSNIIDEHHTVRNAAGLFDVSHMGEVLVTGPEAEAFVDNLVTNNVRKMNALQVMYTVMCYPHGGVVDDLLVYKYNTEKYMLVVNASNVDKDFAWIVENGKDFNVELQNISEKTSQLALQGPKAQEILQKLTNYDLTTIKFFYFAETEVAGKPVIVSRTGYTGEDGFEIYGRPEDACELWNTVLQTGSEQGAKPIGLGARDTLRFEAVLPLYGHEISETITPLEAGLKFFVKLDKERFIGKDALVKQLEAGLPRKLVGFEMVDRGVPRSDYGVAKDGEMIGYVTTGSYSPTLDKNIGLALIQAQYSEIGTEIDIMRGQKALKAKVIPVPFYKKNYKK